MKIKKNKFKIDISKTFLSIIIFSFILIFIVSFFRFASNDETIYLRNTIILSENIKHGQLFGQYYTGLHGFIFNLPIALIYLITGPSVFIATIYNILLAMVTIYLLYKIILKITNNILISYSTALLVLTNFQFFLLIPTFLKETRSVLSILLFLYIFLFNKQKNNKICLGLSLLLILDCKEYIFFTIILAYLISLFFKEIFSTEIITKKILNIMINFFTVLFPSVVWFVLMFFTPIIPINMFLASLTGLINNNLQFLKFTVSQTTILSDFTIQPKLNNFQFITKIPYLNLFFTYIEKILMPYSFSFISIPKIIIIPSIYASIVFFKNYYKQRKIELLFLPLFFIIYLFVYIIRISHGRYLIPIISLAYFFYVLFLFNINKNKKISSVVLTLSLIFSLIGTLYDENYILIKILINIVIFCLTLLLIKSNKIKSYLIALIVVIISIFSLGTTILFSYSTNQIGQFIRWGYNGECYKIIHLIDDKEVVLLNRIEEWSELPYFYRKDTGADPEWYWKLADWVPKKYMLKMGRQKTFDYTWETNDELKVSVEKNKIEKILIIKSSLENYSFPMQEKIEELQTLNWLKLDKIEKLKNKEVYIFIVNKNIF